MLRGEPYIGPEIDVWGLGVLCTYLPSPFAPILLFLQNAVYEMLCGNPPFVGEGMEQEILKGNICFPDYLSTQAIELLKSMLTVGLHHLS